MQYLLLIYANEAKQAELMQTPKAAEYMQGYRDFTDDLKAKGKFIAGEALEGTTTARSVRIREGKVLTTDGPFAETREALGGFYMVEADSIEEALEFAARIPTAIHGTIEVRPIFDWEKASR